eukprot:359517-Chlamydomonas_euryale.AAC.12
MLCARMGSRADETLAGKRKGKRQRTRNQKRRPERANRGSGKREVPGAQAPHPGFGEQGTGPRPGISAAWVTLARRNYLGYVGAQPRHHVDATQPSWVGHHDITLLEPAVTSISDSGGGAGGDHAEDGARMMRQATA